MSFSGLLLHENFVSDMDVVVVNKGSENEMSDAIHTHLLKANAEYLPINLSQLDVPTYIGHLLGLMKKTVIVILSTSRRKVRTARRRKKNNHS